MGNCQAAEVATVVIQHPGGRVERLYWPTSAADVMKSNPGYHVALVTLYVSETKTDGGGGGAGTVRFTRVRLLKPRDMLLLGQVYRLITSQVAKALRQRKYEKLKKNQAESIRKQQQQQQLQQQHGTSDQCTDPAREETEEDSDATHQATNQERDRQKSRTQVAARGRHWRPSLQSISEAGS
ncbi:uncharacterized protein LOC103998299 isoform X2 [Musa acuminata AAA Group]|uniref:uncharacterized protein LOC103998299 isoform X2 n=1 Tax=Musa acuminata AAA Group TaxID=214697 RepID=UPI0031D150BF